VVIYLFEWAGLFHSLLLMSSMLGRAGRRGAREGVGPGGGCGVGAREGDKRRRTEENWSKGWGCGGKGCGRSKVKHLI